MPEDLAFEMKGLSLTYKQGPSTWGLRSPGQSRSGLVFSQKEISLAGNKIKTIAVPQPVISVTLPEGGQKWDWAAPLEKLPDLEQVELSDLQGRILWEAPRFTFPRGRSFWLLFPDQGGKLRYQVKEIKVDLPPKKNPVQGGVQGNHRAPDFPDRHDGTGR